jgi:hypothetical protein
MAGRRGRRFVYLHDQVRSVGTDTSNTNTRLGRSVCGSDTPKDHGCRDAGLYAEGEGLADGDRREGRIAMPLRSGAPSAYHADERRELGRQLIIGLCEMLHGERG